MTFKILNKAVFQLFAFTLLACVCIAAKPHPIHVSVTEAHFKKGAKSLEVSIKFFFDDFERALASTYDTPILLCPDSSNKEFKYVERYLNSAIQLYINNKEVNFEMLGYECENELLYVYLEYKSIGKVKDVKLKNELLFDAFSDQTNLFYLYVNQQKSTLITQQKSPIATLVLD